jgi:hypothetical protein
MKKGTFWVVMVTIMILTGCGGGSSTPNGDKNTTTQNDGDTSGGGTSGGHGGGAASDTTKPVITLHGRKILYLQKRLDYSDAGAEAHDDTDGDISNHIEVNNPLDKDIAGEYIIRYTVRDAAGNAADTVTRTVHVVDSMIKQTTQTKSYDVTGTETAGIRDDGYYQSGVASDYYRDDSQKIVTDRITGLSWQDDTVDQKSFDEATAYCESLSLGGYDDWRMPTIRELMNILQHGEDSTPDIFQTWNTHWNYWSGTSLDANDSKAWGVSASSGIDTNMEKGSIENVRCVRGEAAVYADQVRDDVHKIVFDPNTGLEWQDNETVSDTWESALNYCYALDLDGRGWRLPSYNELYGLLDRTRSVPMGDQFQSLPSQSHWLWTATTYHNKQTDSLIIKPSQGDDKWFSKGSHYDIKCVRTRGVDWAAAALARIQAYAASNGSSNTAPGINDYTDAGVTGVTASNLDDVNAQIRSASESDVDSALKIQNIVNGIVAASIPMPALSVSASNGHSNYLEATLSSVDTATLSKVRLYRNNTNNLSGKVKVVDTTPSSATITYTGDTSLAGCQTYYYWVEACVAQAGGDICRIDTTPVSATTVPDAPTQVYTYAQLVRTLYLKWQNNADNGCTVKYHVYKRTSENGPFTRIPEINDLTDGSAGVTATNVAGNVYIHYRIQAEDSQGRTGSLSCTVADGYPRYGVGSAQDPCRAAVGLTWGDQPRYPWASVNGYPDQVVFTWDDVPLILNDNGTVQAYAGYYRVRFKAGSGAWTQWYDNVHNPFTYNGAQYQMYTYYVSANTSVTIQIETKYQYDNDGDGQLEITYSNPVSITGKTKANSGNTSTLGSPPSATASNYYPGKISVGWTHTSGATYYKLYGKQVSGVCPTDTTTSTIPSGYQVLLGSTTSTTYDHMVSWQKWCYRAQACNAGGCGQVGPHAYGNSTGN